MFLITAVLFTITITPTRDLMPTASGALTTKVTRGKTTTGDLRPQAPWQEAATT